MDSLKTVYSSNADHPNSLTLREGLANYSRANPEFVQNQDLWVGQFRVPWCDLQRHDIMHVVTGYSTDLDQELQLIGFLLTALTWKRPWYYYAQSFVVFLELLWQSLRGEAWGERYVNPIQVCWLYGKGIWQGLTIAKKIDAYMDPEQVMDRTIASLRAEYGIVPPPFTKHS